MNKDEIAISVKNVQKSFKLPHEKHDSIKSIFLKGFRRRKSFEKQRVLKGISFEIKKGEFYGIVGRNGSGKSTLLKLLAGIYTPDSGSITVNGKLTPFIELGVGFNPELTGRENVFLNGALLGFSRSEMEKMYDDIVEFAEIEKFMDQKLKNYSSGMQVRLAFSIAIKAESPILLLDEVLAVGDAAFQKKCLDYFSKLKKDKRTVIFVSHDMSSVQKFCDRALLLKSGEISKVGKTSDVASEYLLEIGATKTKEPDNKQQNDFEFRSIEMIKDDAVFRDSQAVEFCIKYSLKKKINYRIGISILSSGASLHERNTRDIDLSSNPGDYALKLSFPATHLLNGLYQISVAAFETPDLSLIAFDNDATKFYIKNTKIGTGGMIDLGSEWTLAAYDSSKSKRSKDT